MGWATLQGALSKTPQRRICTICGKHFRAKRTFYKTHAECLACILSVDDIYLLESEQYKVSHNLSRARHHDTDATLTLEEWVQTIRDFDGLCAYCGDKQYRHMAHYIPLRDGGGTTANNCIPSCASCNAKEQHARRRGDQFPDSETAAFIESYLSTR